MVMEQSGQLSGRISMTPRCKCGHCGLVDFRSFVLNAQHHAMKCAIIFVCQRSNLVESLGQNLEESGVWNSVAPTVRAAQALVDALSAQQDQYEREWKVNMGL